MELEPDFSLIVPCPLDIKVRADLADYFAVEDYAERTIRCKLAGRNACKMDGKQGTFKFGPSRGWFNFERHLIRVHKFPKEFFEKDKASKAAGEVDRSKLLVQEILASSAGSVSNCVACLLPSSSEPSSTDEELQKYFPGCEGSPQLFRQLFNTFFLKSILHLPMSKCAKFLRSGDGSEMSGLFFLCNSCKNYVAEAAAIHQQMKVLEMHLDGLKQKIIVKFNESADLKRNVGLNNTEIAIRRYVCADKETVADRRIPTSEDDAPIESAEDDLISGGNEMDEWDPVIKVEVDTELTESHTDHATSQLSTRTRRIRPSPVLRVEEDYIGKIEIPDAMSADDDPDFDPSELPTAKEKKIRTVKGRRIRRILRNEKTTKLKKKPKVKIEPKPPIERKRHENWDTTAKGFACKICPAVYPTLTYFNRHMQEHKSSQERGNEFDCEECGYPCTSSKSKEIHKTLKHRGYDQQLELSCSLCPYKASSKKQLARHRKEHREVSQKELVNGKYHCRFCNRLFLSYALLCRHKRNLHHKEMGWAPIVCETCTRIFSTQKHLRDHIQQTHQKQSKFYCDHCGKGFLYMSKLRRHMTSHVRENVYVCEACGADFLYAETLKWHIKKDHPESELVQKGELKDSQNVSENADPSTKHICKHCNAELGSSTLLARHIKSHKELFAHGCHMCGRNYATAQSLRRHIAINHAGNEIPCPYCDKTFSHQEYVRAHYKYCKRHPDKDKIQLERMLGEPVDAEPLAIKVEPNNAGSSSDLTLAVKSKTSPRVKPVRVATEAVQPQPRQDNIQLPSQLIVEPVESVENVCSTQESVI